ncbi:MAG: Trigger factor [Pseudomonadota bacterium]|jgi:trigger factor
MSVQVEQISPYQKRLSFHVEGEEVARRLDEAYRELGRRVNIPGFRRGHVPRKVLEQRFAKNIHGDVASDLVNRRFREAAVDLEIIGQPELERGELRPGAPFDFAVLVQVRPEVQISGYKGLKVDYPAVTVAESQVDALVQARLAQQTKLVEVEEKRAVKAGDLVLTEVTLLEDGAEKVIESGTMINTAGDRYYGGLEALLIGTKKGATKQGTVTFGEDVLLPGVRGKTVEARVKVLGIQVSQTPELTDTVAAELGFEGGVAAMRAALRMEEEGRANEGARNLARVNLLQTLTNANPVPVPPAMIDGHLQLLLEELRIQAAYRGRDPRGLRYSDAQMADLRQRAEFAARASLLLDAVAKAEGIKVTNADLDAKYQEIADQRGQRVEAIRGYFQKDNAVEELRKRLLEERTLEWLLEASELVTVSGDAPASESAPAADEKPKAKAKAKAKKDEAVEAAPEAPAAEEAAPAKKPRAKKKTDAE